MGGKRIGRLAGNAGYTALEALTVVGVMGMMVAFAVPSMRRLKAAHELESATSQVGGMLQQVRARAIAESTPYLVLIQQEEVVDRARSAFALIVRDTDRSYSLTAADGVESFSLDPTLRLEIRQYGQSDGDTTFSDAPLATTDYAVSAGGGLLESLQVSGDALIQTSLSTTSESLDEKAVYGSTFPVGDESGVPTLAFNERGIPVSPDSPAEWGTGAGAVYLTDNQSGVNAAVVSPLGEVGIQRLDASTGTWN